MASISTMDLRIVGLKPEAVAGTGETLAVGDYDFRASEITYDPVFQEFARKYAKLNHYDDASLFGKRTATVTFKVPAGTSGALGTAPEWGKIIQSTGMVETVTASTSVEYDPNRSQDCKTCTIEVRERFCDDPEVQQIVTVVGCVGSVNFVIGELGDGPMFEFSFTGKVTGIETADTTTIIEPTGFDTARLQTSLGSTLDFLGVEQKFGALNFNVANDVQDNTCPSDPTGILHHYINTREITAGADPYKQLKTVENIDSIWAAGTVGTLSYTYGPAANRVTITADAQLITSSAADRNGAITRTNTWKILDNFKILVD